MAKKHFLAMAVIISAILFAIFIVYLPIEVAGHRPGNVPLLVVNAGFLAVTVAFILTFILVVITRWDYVHGQFVTASHFRHLLFLMVKRDFVARYRRSILGILWSLLNPLMTMLVLTMIFSTFFRFGIENFPVYLLSGQLMFNFFSESTNAAMVSITGGAGTIKKVYVPKYIFPVARVLGGSVNLVFSFIAFLFVVLVTQASFYWTMLLLPIPMLYLLAFSLGVGMLLSAVAVFFRDVTYLYGVALTLVMFLTPIFYPVEILPDRVYHLIHLNPMFHYVSYFRELALHGTIPNLWSNIICIGFALAALALGAYVKITQQNKYILYL